MNGLKQALAAEGEPRARFWILEFGEGRDVPASPRKEPFLDED
jgi:hypothetical protein